MFRKRFILAAVLASLAAPAVAAEDTGDVPYWASIRAEEVNMRVGPGEDYRIQWVYHRRLLPLKVLRMKEGWRFVQDPDGARGWILARFLMRERGGYITAGEPAEMHEKADSESKLLWRLRSGVTGKLGDCADNWCEFDVDGRKGYVTQSRLWGAGQP